MDGVSGVSGKGHTVSVCQGGSLQATGNPEAACGIRLKNIDGSSFQRMAEIRSAVAILTRSDRDRRVLADKCQLVEAIEGNWFFKVCDTLVGEAARQIDRLLGGISTVGVYKKLCLRTDRTVCRAHPGQILVRLRSPVFPDFHLHPGNALFGPASKLLH